jgi:peptidoglycan/xylan/chitin deacetylase (PgdA/CDA1 family)
MYHHFIEEGPSTADTVVSADSFADQMRALQEAGYTAVTPEQLIDYVEQDIPLPDKAVVITCDDGYTSNLTIAAPILEKYGMKATVFAIGINVGQTLYPHSGEVLDPPRFSWDEVRPWVEKGVIEVQSHTYDMHQRADYGFSGRDGVLQLPGESEADYRAALANDFTEARDGLKEGLGVDMVALAFPFGLNSKQAVEELEKVGVKVTFTTDFGCRRVIPGEPDTLQCMPRWGISDDITGQELVNGLDQLEANGKWGYAFHQLLDKFFGK